MENNSDKEMRDKLQSVEFPFDPKAWEQMEGKLDKERKPKGIIWWWFGGVAACLLLAVAMYSYHQFGTSAIGNLSPLALNKATNDKNENSTNINTEPSTLNANQSSANLNNQPVENKPTVNENQEANPTHLSQSPQIVSGNTDGKSSSTIKKAKPAKKQLNVATTSTSAKPAAKKGLRKSRDDRPDKNQAATQSNQQSLTASANSFVIGSNTGDNETQAQKASADIRTKLIEPISLDPILTYEFPDKKETADDIMKKQEGGDVNLKKLNKKIFNYSLGIAGNITGSTLGSQAGGTAANAFDRTPSYMVGFTHDFMFFKRFAVTNSVLFSQTSFNVVNDYSSKITEMAIPIGLKAYLVSKSKFRFYLSSGIINHIKFKETFVYQDYFANSYTGSGPLPAAIAFNSATNSYNGASELSINQSKRYYASFYSSAGAEFVVQKHFVFFTEPLFYMSLQKAGTQDNHKYNVGLSGGIRYQF